MHPEDRTERRRDYDVKIDVLTERVENWMESTTDYRKALCGKLDHITTRLDNLQCSTHTEKAKALRVDVDRLMVGAWTIIMILFVSGAAWGTLSNTVEINTKKWELHEPELRAIIKDIELLKDRSGVYRGIPTK